MLEDCKGAEGGGSRGVWGVRFATHLVWDESRPEIVWSAFLLFGIVGLGRIALGTMLKSHL